MARLIAAGALAGATIAACFSAPTRPASDGDGGVDRDGRIDGLTGDAHGDGPFVSPDADPTKCVSDDFLGSGSGTCGSSMWGTPTSAGSGSGVAYLSNTGELKLTTNGSPSGFVNCTSGALAWNRVIVDIEAVGATVTADRTFVGLQSADGTLRWGLEFFDAAGPAFTPVCNDGGLPTMSLTSWNSSTQHYVKIERTGAAEISIGMSDNTTTFTQVDTCSPQGGVLDTTSAQLRVFKSSSTSGPGATAIFRSIELCHD